MIIYKIINKTNGMIYIGQTKGHLQRRIYHHFADRRSYISKALNKHGLDSFDVSTIDTAQFSNDLNEKERYWIRFYNCKVPRGYNLNGGGQGIYKPSEETKQKMIESHKGKKQSQETIAKRIAKLRGRKNSEAIKEKMRRIRKGKGIPRKTIEMAIAANKGKKHSKEHSEKISKALIDYYSKNPKRPYAEQTIIKMRTARYKHLALINKTQTSLLAEQWADE